MLVRFIVVSTSKSESICAVVASGMNDTCIFGLIGAVLAGADRVDNSEKVASVAVLQTLAEF
jgi:hypothetical protein